MSGSYTWPEYEPVQTGSARFYAVPFTHTSRQVIGDWGVMTTKTGGATINLPATHWIEPIVVILLWRAKTWLVQTSEWLTAFCRPAHFWGSWRLILPSLLQSKQEIWWFDCSTTRFCVWNVICVLLLLHLTNRPCLHCILFCIVVTSPESADGNCTWSLTNNRDK